MLCKITWKIKLVGQIRQMLVWKWLFLNIFFCFFFRCAREEWIHKMWTYKKSVQKIIFASPSSCNTNYRKENNWCRFFYSTQPLFLTRLVARYPIILMTSLAVKLHKFLPNNPCFITWSWALPFMYDRPLIKMVKIKIEQWIESYWLWPCAVCSFVVTLTHVKNSEWILKPKLQKLYSLDNKQNLSWASKTKIPANIII